MQGLKGVRRDFCWVTEERVPGDARSRILRKDSKRHVLEAAYAHTINPRPKSHASYMPSRRQDFQRSSVKNNVLGSKRLKDSRGIYT